jgi:hypothetical protein
MLTGFPANRGASANSIGDPGTCTPAESGDDTGMEDRQPHREFTRVAWTIETELRAPTEIVHGLARDVSLKGMFVECSSSLTVGTDCDAIVHLSTEDDPEWRVEAKARVARVTAEGIAVEFRDLIGLDSYWNLRSIVLYNSPNPELAEKEFADHAGLRPRR